MRAAKPLADMMSLDEYMDVAEVWDKMPGEDSCPFEPKASDWGRTALPRRSSVVT
jgi:hypothetical protein